MKKFFILSLLFLATYTTAQQKYQSLLWKISGNGLEKDSYLYGTMHVSSKVAFRLDDVFYSSLLASEVVALESDPTTWMEHNYEMMDAMSSYDMGFGYGQKDFYAQRFGFNSPNEQVIRSAIRFDSNIVNGYLYRKRPGGDNFEEETYLDMFIFQAGKKQQKPVVGLEDFKESRYLTTKASYNVAKRKVDAWLLKKYKETSSFDLTEEAYRNRNLDLLDSIGEATNTEHFRKYMLYERNYNMVKALDSLMPKSAVFAGVGAAHLPGKDGMIEILRRQGYTVTPLTSKKTTLAKRSKKKLEATFIAPKLTAQSTDDNFLTIKSFEKLRELNFLNQKYYVATDMTNGAYLAINRMNTFEYLAKKETTDLKDIDNLLFEDIPGEIIEKTYFEKPYKGINIRNKTKKGDYQRYAIYKTPLEIIIVKLGGKKDYVLKYGDEIFNSITFRATANTWENFEPAFKKYHFSIPANYITENYNMAGRKIAQSYNDKGFYFFEEVPIHDTRYIEEDAFEAAYIHKAFLDQYDLKPANGSFKDDSRTVYKTSTPADTTAAKKIVLQSVLKDDTYYLMGYVGNDVNSANKFFNSFKLQPIVYVKNTEKVIDTSLHFSVNTTAKQPFPFIGYNNRKKKPYQRFVKTARYISKTNEVIKVERTKYHDFKMYKNIDSLWSRLERYYKPDYYLTNKKKTVTGNVYTYTFLVKDSLSDKQIRVKNILKKGTLFKLKTLESSKDKSSKFVTDFYSSFSIKDTLLGRDLFEDKVPKFLDALKKNDSIVYSSQYLLNFDKSHGKLLVDFLKDFKFPKDKEAIKTYLVGELVALNNPATTDYIKQLYTKSYNTPEIQIAIIRSLIQRKDEASYKLVLALLNTDFPVSNSYNIKSLFYSSMPKDTLSLKRKLFPELLKYSTINEYKQPVYSLLSKLKTKKLIKVKEYKKYKDQLTNDAKLELKRSLYKKANKRNYNYSTFRGSSNSLLGDYVELLFPFREEKDVHLFFYRLLESNDAEALAQYYVLLKQYRLVITQKLSDKLNKTENFSTLIDKLESHEISHKLLETEAGKQKYAQAKLFKNKSYRKDNDEVIFIKKEVLKVKKDDVIAYFFKEKKGNMFSANNSYIHYIAFKQQNGKMLLKPYVKSNNSGVMIDQMTTEKELTEKLLDKIRYKDRKRLSNFRYNNMLN